jgi:outer membrane receptor protein involved in Fe transport
LALLPLAAPALADQAVETVVVTASPPDPVGNDAFSTVRITPEQIRSKHQLDAALKDVPGLSLFRRDSSLNANPTVQGVTLRSIAPSGAGRALVTLDGVPQNDPFGNWVIWNSLPGEDIAKGQVVRGAGSGPYGAGALTGVIALDEAKSDGLYAADVSGGSLGQRRVGVAGGVDIDRFQLFGSASAEASDGWIPVAPDQRGAADDALTLDARQVSLRAETLIGGDTLISARGGFYDEHRNSGLVGAQSSAEGTTASLTVAHPESKDTLGWRLQVWMRDVGLTNTSVSIATNRAGTTVTNDQYAVPATGWGGNAALRGVWGWLNWEVGTDARFAEGESRELFSTGLASRRLSGGTSAVEGLYVESAARSDGWLFTLGARVDGWETSNGHLVESTVATGAITKQLSYPDRSGTLPTARAGVRYDFSPEFYLRGAVYAGFRAPSLNELYRPFRVGQITTLANPALVPEELYGGEVGMGGQWGRLSWDATAFWNQLHNAIANVTIATNTQMRENAGDIDAYGIEGEASFALNDHLRLDAALDVVNAEVDQTHLRPAQAPRWTITAGFEAEPLDRLSVAVGLRFESRRFSDDLNTPSLALDAVTTADAKIAYVLTKSLSVYIYGDNLFNARVASTAAVQPLTNGLSGVVTNYAAPRIIGGGLSFSQ